MPTNSITQPWTAQSILHFPISQRLSHLPSYLKIFLDAAVLSLDPERIWIFGSRARGDARMTSDFDIAFQISAKQSVKNWENFCLLAIDSPPSLHLYDWVDFNRAGEDLRQNIERDGVIIYERKNGS